MWNHCCQVREEIACSGLYAFRHKACVHKPGVCHCRGAPWHQTVCLCTQTIIAGPDGLHSVEWSGCCTLVEEWLHSAFRLCSFSHSIWGDRGRWELPLLNKGNASRCPVDIIPTNFDCDVKIFSTWTFSINNISVRNGTWLWYAPLPQVWWITWILQTAFNSRCNVLYIYCTSVRVCACACINALVHLCLLVLSEIDRVERLLFYLIYLWFPLSEILIPAINQPLAIDGERNLHTCDAGKMCVCFSEFPAVCLYQRVCF